MPNTSRFGLTLGAILSDHDKKLIDAVLSSLELHDHAGGAQLADPAGPPTAVLVSTGGRLPASTTFYYRLALVDQYGLETAGSAETVVSTPAAVAAPATPTVGTVTGGLLAIGVYYYALSSVDSSGNETALSTPVTLAVLVTNSTVNILGRTPFPTGAVAYNVWRRGPRTSGFTKIGQITTASTPFADTGSVADDPYARDPTRLSQVNTTNATSLVTLGPSTTDLALTSVSGGSIRAWRLYRATSSGGYTTTSLLAEVNGTVNSDGTGGLLPSFTDDGTTALVTGKPQDTSQTLHPSIVVASSHTAPTHLTVASTSYQWLLAAGLDGSLVPVASDNALGPGGVFLASSTGVWWQVTMDDTGAIGTTAQVPALSTDLAYLAAEPPLLPTSDPGITYQLTVTDDGALVTTGIGATIPA